MHSEDFLKSVSEIALSLEHLKVEAMVNELARCRMAKGKVFVIGLGGSLANAVHMSADLRKLCDIDAYAPDNIAELTARANDEGLHTIFTGWMREIQPKDILFVLSVGGGTERVSQGITEAVKKAKGEGAKILGIVGPYGGATAELGDVVIRVPASINPTPFTEAFQGVIWHAIVSHPLMQRRSTKW